MQSSGTMPHDQVYRLMLCFDAGCVTCGGMAAGIEEAADGRLEVVPLSDPRVEQWRRRALGEDAPWVPTLIEVKGARVRAWIGARMGIALSRRLGPTATWRVLRVLGESQAARGSERTGAASGTGGISRRQFLKGLAGGLAALSILPSGAFASPGSPAVGSGVLSLKSVPSNAAAIGRLKRFRGVRKLDARFGEPDWSEVMEVRLRVDGSERRSYDIPLRPREGSPAANPDVKTHLVVEDEATLEEAGSVVMRMRQGDDGQPASVTWYVPEGGLVDTHGIVDGRLVTRSPPAEEAAIHRGQVAARRSFRRCFAACVGVPFTRFCANSCIRCTTGSPPGSCAICAACTGGVGAYCAIRCAGRG